MTEGGDGARLTAWARELRQVHERLRDALETVQEAAGRAQQAEAGRDVLLFCHGFCTALTGHHEGEDRAMFPAIEAEHPELAGTLRALQQDHAAMARLLGELRGAVDRQAPPADLGRHLEGVAAIMESHFRYEERVLTQVLVTLRLDADPRDVL